MRVWWLQPETGRDFIPSCTCGSLSVDRSHSFVHNTNQCNLICVVLNVLSFSSSSWGSSCLLHLPPPTPGVLLAFFIFTFSSSSWGSSCLLHIPPPTPWVLLPFFICIFLLLLLFCDVWRGCQYSLGPRGPREWRIPGTP